uniref:Uncharacterized protein n=1 Tax=Romanomermis culicivorax TaxID=13658 RepID=A0A915L0D8_ROMCU
MLLIEVTGPDLEFLDGHCCSRNTRCRAEQSVLEKLPPGVREPLHRTFKLKAFLKMQKFAPA